MDFPHINQQAKQMDAFAMGIKNKQNSIVPGEMGIRDVKYLQAIHEAMNRITTGQVCELPDRRQAQGTMLPNQVRDRL
jgi:hypothetical protein